MTSRTTSIKHFAFLNRAPGVIWAEATKRKAPHKPLLLSVPYAVSSCLPILRLLLPGCVATPRLKYLAEHRREWRL